MTIYARMLTAK